MKKYYILLLICIVNFFTIQAQLSNEHYLPPLKQGGNNQAIRQQAFYLSTPETIAFDVNVFQGTNATPVAAINISSTSSGQYNVADGDNNITLVTNTNTGVVLNTSGLRFESVGGQEFYVNYRGRSNSQATSLTSKGRQSLGTLFKWGGRPNFGNGQTSLNATLGIMATEPGTTTINIFGYGTDCEFRLQGDNDGITDDTLTISLTQGQTYVLEAVRNATNANIDCWLGATIQSDKKIAISNGNLNGAPRIGSNSRDALIDQPVPENVLGREYIFIRGNGVNDTETPIIIGTQNGTDISVAGVIVATINTGEYYVIDGSNYSPPSVSGNMYVTTSKEVYAYQHLSGASGIFTGGLNFIAPVNCLLPDNLNNISNIRDVDGRNFDGGITIVASTTTPNANIVVTDNTGPVGLVNEQTVNGTGDWKTFYIPGLTGNVSVQSTGPIAVGFLGVNGAAGIAGYFSGFDTVPIVELDVTGGGCLPGSDVFEISGNFDAYQWFENGTEITGETNSAYTPMEPGDFFVRVTRGTCTYDSAILSAYNCDPEIVLTKTVDATPVVEGDTVTFTITVEHLGVNPVTNLVINDMLPPELSFGTVTPSFGSWTAPDWTIGNMFSGEVHTLTVEATVNEVSAGITVTNTISNSQDQIEANTITDDLTEDVTIINNELNITKVDQAAIDGSYDTVGEVITYNFVVTNTGDQILPSVTISDPNIDSGSLTPPSVSNLGIGASANFTATHTITQDDIEAGQVINSAMAEGTLSNGFVITDISDDPDNPNNTIDDPTITPIDQKGALILEKIAQPSPDGLYDSLGEAIIYEFTVINTGNVSINNVTITDSNIDPGSISPTSVANLPAGSSAVFTATHTIVQADFNAGNTTNSATVTGTEIIEGDLIMDTSDDPTTLAPNDATVVSIPQFGQLEVTKVDSLPGDGAFDTVGETITYTIVATNIGTVSLTNVNVVDPNADTITLQSTTGTDGGGDEIVDNLAPTETATFIATHQITQEDLDNAEVINTATVGGLDPVGNSVTDLSDDPNDPATSDSDPTVATLVSTPSLTVSKSADDPGNVSEGQLVIYTYIVTNAGNVTFDEVSLNDIHSGTGTLGTLVLQNTTGIDDGADNDVDQLGPGATATWLAEYVITAVDITNQLDITNTVTVTGTPRTGSITAPTADETVTVNPIETICGGITLAHDLTNDVDPSIVSFSWSAANNPLVNGETTSTTSTTDITDTLINIANSDQEVVYTITGFDVGGVIRDVYTYTVTILQTPIPNNNVNQTICSGRTLNRRLINDIDNFNDNINFSWSAVDNPNITGETITASSDNRIQDTLINTSTVAQEVVYTITPTATNGCSGSLYIYTVTVDPMPTGTAATERICSDEVLNHQLANDVDLVGVTFSWQAADNPNVTGETTSVSTADEITDSLNNASGALQDVIYTVTPTSTDGCVGAAFTVTVTVEPELEVPSDDTETVECLSDATQPVTPIVMDINGNTIIPTITENTDPTCEGEKIYTFTYTDCAGNDNIYMYTYTIDDTIPPTGTAPADITDLECITDVPSADVALITDESDNCLNPVSVTVADTNNGGSGCNGDAYIVTRTYTLTDCGGLTTDLVQTITVEDTTPPTGTAPADITGLECITDVPAADIALITDESDNCLNPVSVTVADTNNGGSGCNGDAYIVTRTYTLTDCGGLTTDLVQTITVEDTEAPTGTAPADITGLECITDVPAADIALITDESDNCLNPVSVTVADTNNGGSGCNGDAYIVTRTYTLT
ncbi:PKD-like domain-containing protein, partial [Aquimarina sp. RZ0]|uniref:PKD-like domain-containing protein n=1 Tax=Aquimarina sp. RZ0 TaxID=2607730 RepID=UPI0011F0C9F4